MNHSHKQLERVARFSGMVFVLIGSFYSFIAIGLLNASTFESSTVQGQLASTRTATDDTTMMTSDRDTSTESVSSNTITTDTETRTTDETDALITDDGIEVTSDSTRETTSTDDTKTTDTNVIDTTKENVTVDDTTSTDQTTDSTAEPTQTEETTDTVRTTDETETDALKSTDTQEDDKEVVRAVEPVIRFNISYGETLKEVERIEVRVDDARKVELYIKQEGSLTRKYLGTASKVSDDTWKYVWDTTQTPNGRHWFSAEVQNAYGAYASDPLRIYIDNEREEERTLEQEKYVEEITKVAEEVQKVEEEIQRDATKENETTTERSDSSEPIISDDLVRSTDTLEKEFVEHEADEVMDTRAGGETTSPQKEYEKELTGYLEEEMKDELEALSISVRTQNDTNTALVEEDLNALAERTINLYLLEVPKGSEEYEELRKETEAFVWDHINKEREEIVRKETIIRDRVDERVFDDSDKDGISDYDEVNIYDTDPFVADTDADGFIDGSEIMRGFDPKDPTVESPIVYEDPKETGIVRADILTVENIERYDGDSAVDPQLAKDEEVVDVPPTQKPVAERAKITGRALPNSFITLYIFSEPIVVTVKTQDDGSWEYIFDKELEDGTHEVYVGVTDNAGKLIAKSEPFTFVKEAQAFTPAQAAATTAPPPTPEPVSLFDEYVMLLAVSLSVVVLGLLLLIIGAYIKSQRENMFIPTRV